MNPMIFTDKDTSGFKEILYIVHVHNSYHWKIGPGK